MMTNEVTTSPQPIKRSLYILATTQPWALSLGAFDPEMRENLTAADIDEVMAAVGLTIVPAKSLDAMALTAAERDIADALRPIGAKIMPTAGEEQGRAWLVAVAIGLTDLPAKLVVRAARDALHQVFRFPNEAEDFIRTKAMESVATITLGLRRMEVMKRDIHAAQSSTPKITHQPKPWTVERVKDTPVGLIRIGIACGAIAQGLVDQAFPDGLPQSDVGRFAAATTGDECTEKEQSR